MNIIGETVKTKKHINEYSFLDLFKDIKRGGPKELKDKADIKAIKPVGTKDNICKIYSDGQSVYANTRFYTNDIVEICPCRIISKGALYAEEVRQLVFEVSKNTMYVVPFGYCQFYNLIEKPGDIANCDYIWDPNQSVIVIKALVDIPKGSKLILNIEK